MNTSEQANTTLIAGSSLRAQANSREAAMQLAAQGKLERLLLMPVEFGGVDATVNVVYVPSGVVQEKSQFDALVTKLVAQGEVSYQATPEYDDDSFIPSRIELQASGPEWLMHVIDVDAYL